LTQKIAPFLVAVLLWAFAASCTKEETFAPKDRGAIVEIIERGSLSRDQVVARMNELDGSSIAQYDVKFYAITYRSQYMGKPIDTRGLIIVP